MSEWETYLQKDTQVTLFPLVMQWEDGEYVVGRTTTSNFVSLPEVGGQTIQLLQQGHTLGEIQTTLGEIYNAEIEIEDFINTLIDLGFVKFIDGHPLKSDEEHKPIFPWLQTAHVAWLFAIPTQILYFSILSFGGITLFTHPQLIPHYQDFFWTNRPGVVIAVNTLIFTINLICHEFAHLVAARSLGVPSHITLGTRLYNLVVQTDVTGVWAVPRHQRYRVYWAGIAWDLIPISLSIIALAYLSLPLLVKNLLYTMVLLNFLGILKQFSFFMRTDIYFVMMDWLKCRNLFNDSLDYLRFCAKRYWFRLPPQFSTPLVDPLVYLPKHEQQKVRAYAWFTLFASSITLVTFFFYGMPIMIGIFYRALQAIVQGLDVGDFWLTLDGCITLVIEGGLQVLFIITFLKTHLGTVKKTVASRLA